MEFKTVSIIKQPPAIVWATMRDQLPEIVELVDEVDSIVVQSRKKTSDGNLEVINIWTARPQLPDMIARFVKPEMLAWSDIATWDEKTMICNWKIDSHYFREKMDCTGSTKFEKAIGGRGCRLTFQGNIYWDGSVPMSFGVMDGMVSKALESVIGKMVPGNFQKMASAIERFIGMQTV